MHSNNPMLLDITATVELIVGLGLEERSTYLMEQTELA